MEASMHCNTFVGTDTGLVEITGANRDIIPDRSVSAFVRDSSHWWTIVDSTELWRSIGDSPDPDSWETVARETSVGMLCLYPWRGGVLVGCTEARLLQYVDGSLTPVESFNTVPGRDSWYTPWGGPPDVRSMCPGVHDRLHVNVHVGGIAMSEDSMQNWTQLVDIGTDVHEVCYDPDTGYLFAPAAVGVGVSEDGGNTWRFDTDGLHGKYCRAATISGDTLLVSASTGPRTDHGAVYRRPLSSDGHFEKCAEGLPEFFRSNIDTHCLRSSGTSVVIGTLQGNVFESTDMGSHWTLVREGLSQIHCVWYG
jgi:hypothetical protein